MRDELVEELIQLVDAALADSVRRSGPWLACRPGCSQCCFGVFEITAVDGARLRVGMAELEAREPERAAAVKLRVEAARERLEPWYPGDPVTGVLTGTEEEIELFEEFAHADACPALNPATGRCDLYAHRPLLCRTFGPPIRNEDGDEGELGMCELNFVGASEEQVLAGEMSSAFREAEAEANQAYAEEHPGCGGTIVAFALGSGVSHSSRDEAARLTGHLAPSGWAG